MKNLTFKNSLLTLLVTGMLTTEGFAVTPDLIPVSNNQYRANIMGAQLPTTGTAPIMNHQQAILPNRRSYLQHGFNSVEMQLALTDRTLNLAKKKGQINQHRNDIIDRQIQQQSLPIVQIPQQQIQHKPQVQKPSVTNVTINKHNQTNVTNIVSAVVHNTLSITQNNNIKINNIRIDHGNNKENTAQIAQNKKDIKNIQNNINKNNVNIVNNRQDIKANQINISKNSKDILNAQIEINKNKGAIQKNTGNIQANKHNIHNNSVNIAHNTQRIN
ncbi:hypothetical protein, partial [Pasteurella dagmatis]